MTMRNCTTCQVSEENQFDACLRCTGPDWPNWVGKEVDPDIDVTAVYAEGLRQSYAEVDRLKAQLAEEAEAHGDAMNLAYADINALKDKWYRRGISGFQEAVKKEREECAALAEDVAAGRDAEVIAAAIRARSIQFDEARADAIGQNGNEGLHYPDPNVESVRARLSERAAAGLKKYGTDTTRTDLTRAQWLRHAQDEALDLAVYLEWLIADESSGPLDILDCLQDRPVGSGKAVPGKCVNLAICEVGREWRKCWRSGCADAEHCVATNGPVKGRK